MQQNTEAALLIDLLAVPACLTGLSSVAANAMLTPVVLLHIDPILRRQGRGDRQAPCTPQSVLIHYVRPADYENNINGLGEMSC